MTFERKRLRLMPRPSLNVVAAMVRGADPGWRVEHATEEGDVTTRCIASFRKRLRPPRLLNLRHRLRRRIFTLVPENGTHHGKVDAS